MRAIAAKLPEWIKAPLRRVRRIVKDIPYYGTGRYCPVCDNHSSRFRPFGAVPRADAKCTHCGALERHRFLWLYITKHTDLLDGAPKKMLHVAPEACLEANFKTRLGDSYLTADLFDPGAMIKMDITSIDFPDDSFDVIYCSHVLEHVEDDRQAMREFHRVMKPKGWAILLVPIGTEKTLEDPAIVDPAERLKAFGQADHVRLYGLDYADRLGEAGFKVQCIEVKDLVTTDEAIRLGLTPASGSIYLCTK